MPFIEFEKRGPAPRARRADRGQRAPGRAGALSGRGLDPGPRDAVRSARVGMRCSSAARRASTVLVNGVELAGPRTLLSFGDIVDHRDGRVAVRPLRARVRIVRLAISATSGAGVCISSASEARSVGSYGAPSSFTSQSVEAFTPSSSNAATRISRCLTG